MKAKLKIWLLILGICFAATYGKDFVIESLSDNTIHRTVSTNTTDVNLNLKIGDTYKSLTLEPSNNLNDADYIITNHSDENLYTDYTKLDSYLYSPFVFIGNNAISNNTEGLIINDKKENSRFTKELAYMVLGLESDLTWSQIKLTNKDIGKGKEKEKINIIIPNKRSPYYEYVKDLFILCLNDFNEPTIEEYNSLLPRVLKILDKCEKVEDVGQYLYEKNLEDEANPLNGLVLAPECIISDNHKSFDSSFWGGYSYNIITPTITTAIYYDVYIKKNQSEEIDNIRLFKDLANNESDFIVNTGLRSSEMNLDILSNKYYKGTLINLKLFDYDFSSFKDKESEKNIEAEIQIESEATKKETVKSEKTEDSKEKETTIKNSNGEKKGAEKAQEVIDEAVNEASADEESEEGISGFTIILIIVGVAAIGFFILINEA